MNDKFIRSLQFTSRWEGGYVNHPDDPGGETKYGISKRAYPKLDIKNLTREKANELYYQDYWLAAGCDNLSVPLCLVAFDSAVNHGVNWAKQYIKASNGNFRLMLQLRLGYYNDIIKRNPRLAIFRRGWERRWNDLKREAEAWDAEEKAKVQVPTT